RRRATASTSPRFPRSRRGWVNDEALSAERLDSGLGAAEDQRMDVVRALVGVDRFQIHHMADHMEFVMDAVAAMHVAGEAGDIERLAAIVALQHRDRLGRAASLVLEAAEPNAGNEPERNLGLYVDE